MNNSKYKKNPNNKCNFSGCGLTFATQEELSAHIRKMRHVVAIAYFSGLGPQATKEDLAEALKDYAPQEIRIWTRADKMGNRHGSICFKTLGSMYRAINKCRHIRVHGSSVTITKKYPHKDSDFVSEEGSAGAESCNANDECQGHIANIDRNTTEEDVREAFKGIDLKDVKVVTRDAQGKQSSYTYAVLYFRNKRDFVKAQSVREMNGRQIRVEARRERERTDVAKEYVPLYVHVSRLPANIKEKGLKRAFAGLSVESVEIREKPRGDGVFRYAFIKLSTEKDYLEALKINKLRDGTAITVNKKIRYVPKSGEDDDDDDISEEEDDDDDNDNDDEEETSEEEEKDDDDDNDDEETSEKEDDDNNEEGNEKEKKKEEEEKKKEKEEVKQEEKEKESTLNSKSEDTSPPLTTEDSKEQSDDQNRLDKFPWVRNFLEETNSAANTATTTLGSSSPSPSPPSLNALPAFMPPAVAYKGAPPTGPEQGTNTEQQPRQIDIYSPEITNLIKCIAERVIMENATGAVPGVYYQPYAQPPQMPHVHQGPILWVSEYEDTFASQNNNNNGSSGSTNKKQKKEWRSVVEYGLCDEDVAKFRMKHKGDEPTHLLGDEVITISLKGGKITREIPPRRYPVVVTNVPDDVSEENMIDVVEQGGPGYVAYRLTRDNVTGDKSIEVMYCSEEEAREAVRNFNDVIVNGFALSSKLP